MADLRNFDASQVDPSGSFDALPAGWYKACIIASVMKPTKAGNGQYLSLEFQVLEGAHANRTVFANLTLNHPNATTVEIAQRNLSAICHAVGNLNPGQSENLHDIPLLIKLTIRISDQYGEQNDIKDFRALEGGAQAQIPTSAPRPDQLAFVPASRVMEHTETVTPPLPAQANAGGTPPWDQ